MRLEMGDKGEKVEALQRALNGAGFEPQLKVDGHFGARTEAAVEWYQESRNLLVDGIVGAVTWQRMTGIQPDTMRIVRVECDRYGEGYGHTKLREDAADALTRVRDELHDLGCMLTSSGGLRGLSASVGANRSATSLHYLGRAHDLFVHSAMHDPDSDQYIVARDGERHFRVYAPSPQGDELTVWAVTWSRGAWKETKTTQRLVDVTAIMARHGFERIPARKRFWRTDGTSSYGAAEWWHFQWTVGLVRGETTFGDELRKLYSVARLEGSPPWRYRSLVYGSGWA